MLSGKTGSLAYIKAKRQAKRMVKCLHFVEASPGHPGSFKCSEACMASLSNPVSGTCSQAKHSKSGIPECNKHRPPGPAACPDLQKKSSTAVAILSDAKPIVCSFLRGPYARHRPSNAGRCEITRHTSASAQVLCATCSAQVALRKALCASCSARVTLRKLLCASCSAQAALRKLLGASCSAQAF